MHHSAGNEYGYIANGLTLKGANGTGNDTVNVGSVGGAGALIFDDNQTIDNATINLGAAGGDGGSISDQDTTGTGGNVLTLGSNLTINANETSEQNYIGNDPYFSDVQAESIVSKGAINVASGSLQIDPTSFTNQGAIAVIGGATLYLQPTTSFTNLVGQVLTGGTYVAAGGSIVQLSNDAAIATLNADVTLNAEAKLGAGLAIGANPRGVVV
jgi:hypothetical protein